MGLKIMAVGATSSIAQAAERIWAAGGAEFYLVGRSPERLGITAEDLAARGGVVRGQSTADFSQRQDFAAIHEAGLKALGQIDVLFICHGMLPDQDLCEADPDYSEQVVRINFLSVMGALIPAADYFEKRRGGTIAVVGSVAGDRGRASNYTYGAAKGALEHYLQGLRARLSRHGVRVLTIKPGYVDTPMIGHLPKSALFASPASVGRGIVRAVRQRKDVVYLPGFWRWVMAGVRAVPEGIFKNLRI